MSQPDYVVAPLRRYWIVRYPRSSGLAAHDPIQTFITRSEAVMYARSLLGSSVGKIAVLDESGRAVAMIDHEPSEGPRHITGSRPQPAPSQEAPSSPPQPPPSQEAPVSWRFAYQEGPSGRLPTKWGAFLAGTLSDGRIEVEATEPQGTLVAYLVPIEGGYVGAFVSFDNLIDIFEPIFRASPAEAAQAAPGLFTLLTNDYVEHAGARFALHPTPTGGGESKWLLLCTDLQKAEVGINAHTHLLLSLLLRVTAQILMEMVAVANPQPAAGSAIAPPSRVSTVGDSAEALGKMAKAANSMLELVQTVSTLMGN